jgi:hypothetical protein
LAEAFGSGVRGFGQSVAIHALASKHNAISPIENSNKGRSHLLVLK